MPDNEKTEIVCIIDRSGSMSSMATEAIGGFNSFLAGTQRAYRIVSHAVHSVRTTGGAGSWKRGLDDDSSSGGGD